MKGRKGSDSSRRAVLGIILLALIIIGDIVSGAVGIASPVSRASAISQIQTGQTNQCTITVGQAQCSVSITFPTAFTKTPTVIIHEIVTSPSEPNIIATPIAFPVISDTVGLAWPNMPVAKTELMGNTNDEQEVPIGIALPFNQANIMVNCVTASNSANAVLWAQWADPLVFPYSFTNLTDITDVNNCGNLPPFFISQSGFAPFLSPRPSSGDASVILRVMGSGGGGAGDTPVFSQIQIQFASSITQSASPGLETIAVSPLTATGFTVTFGMDSTFLGDILVSSKWTAYT